MNQDISVIIDCDPGHDDVLAILLAEYLIGGQIRAITTVAGNSTVENTSQNAVKFCSLAGIKDIPILKGMSRGIVYEREYLVSPMHGKTGLDGYIFPEPTIKIEDEHAVDFIRKLLMESSEDITIITTGPLTNIATALIMNTEMKSKIKEIVIMGGAIGLGNRTPAAEFNIWADPEAAFVVFNSGIAIKVIPLEVTHKVLFREEHLIQLKKMKTKLSQCILGMMTFAISCYRKTYNIKGYPIHDACAVSAALIPSVIKEKKLVFGTIELCPGINHGRTIFDIYNRLGKEPNITLITDINSNEVIKNIFYSIENSNDPDFRT